MAKTEQSIGMRIRECRISKGLTQEKIAETICCKRSLISQYENTKRYNIVKSEYDKISEQIEKNAQRKLFKGFI